MRTMNFSSMWKQFTRCKHEDRGESYARATTLARPGVTYPHGVPSRCYLERDGMSITSGITGGGSYSGSSTLRWNRGLLGLPVNYRGRNWNLTGFATNEQLITALALLPLAGPLGSAARGLAVRGLHLATRPLFWAAVNVYEEAKDIRSWMRGDPMSWQLKIKLRPISKLGPLSIPGLYGIPVIPVPMPYLDFTKSPSSGVGGPGEIPNLHRPPPSIEETGKLISNPPMEGDVKRSPRVIEPVKNRYEPDNPGLYWCPDGYHLRKHRGRWMCVRKG